jgi:hypothetical protein
VPAGHPRLPLSRRGLRDVLERAVSPVAEQPVGDLARDRVVGRDAAERGDGGLRGATGVEVGAGQPDGLFRDPVVAAPVQEPAEARDRRGEEHDPGRRRIDDHA